MAKKIRINSTTGPSDGADLSGYYFQEIDGTNGYNFYAQNGGSPLNSLPITPTNPTFSFSIPQPPPNPNNNTLNYTLTVTSFPAIVQMSGNWADTVTPGNIEGVPGSGTFQAQASTTGPMDEEAAAASAK